MDKLRELPQTDTKHNILTILSATVFLLCVLIDEFVDIKYNMVFLAITSLIYKYAYFYIENEYIHTFFGKLDHLAIIAMTLTHIDISYVQFILVSCISMIKYELFYLICFLVWVYLTTQMYFVDKNYFSIHIIASTCYALSYINFRVNKKWTFWNSWSWHLSSIVWFMCVVCSKYHSHDKFIETHAKDKLPYLLKLSKISSYV